MILKRLWSKYWPFLLLTVLIVVVLFPILVEMIRLQRNRPAVIIWAFLRENIPYVIIIILLVAVILRGIPEIRRIVKNHKEKKT